MNLHEVFVFLLNFDDKLQQAFLMWLEKYPRLEQDSLVCIIVNASNYKFKQKVRKNNFDHKTIHKDRCRCEQYYKAVSEMTKFPYSIVGKCLNQRTYSPEAIPPDTIIQCSYAERVVAALAFHDVPITNTHKLQSTRFKTFPNYEKKTNTLTIYTLLTLLKKEDFNFYMLTSHLDVIEIATIYALLNGVITVRFIDNLLPNYCRSLRYIDNSIAKDTHRDVLCEIYDKFFNMDLRTQFPNVNYISMSLRPIRVCNKVPKESEIIQLGYVGERFVMHAINNQMHTMNDFAEYLGVYSHIAYPFEDDTDCVLECVKSKGQCFIVDVYVYRKILVYHESPRKRLQILGSIGIKDSSNVKIASVISNDDILRYMDISAELLHHGYHHLSYDSLIFRGNDNTIRKYVIPKPRINFSACGSITTEYITNANCDYGAKYSGYFLLVFENDRSWSLNVWENNSFIDVGRVSLPVSFFENHKKSNIIVKVSFNRITNKKIQEIVGIVKKKYKSIYNCLSMEDLVK